jgi:hypothetical protein
MTLAHAFRTSLLRGRVFAFSQRITVRRVIPSRAASASWLIPFASLACLRFMGVRLAGLGHLKSDI